LNYFVGTVFVLPERGGIDGCLSTECPNSRVAVIGKILVSASSSASSSAYLRSVPLLLVFVSSAAMVVGVFLTGKQLRRLEKNIAGAVGCDWKELVCRVQNMIATGKQSLEQKLANTIDCVDGMVADEVIRTIVKTGNEFVSCIAGGIVLYSLPDEMLPSVSQNNEEKALVLSQLQSGRRRVILCGSFWFERIFD
jgi:hypothetical protein